MANFEPTADDHEAYKALVQYDLITQAKRTHAEAQERAKATAAEVAEAQRALDAAKRVSDDAVAGTGDLSPMDAEEALELAERRARVAAKMHAAAERARDEAAAGIQSATAAAHVPAYRDGIRRRFRACIAADAARAAIAQAQRDYDHSAWMLNGACANGVQRAFSSDGHFAGRDIINLRAGESLVAQEAQYWREPGNGWWKGEEDLLPLIADLRKEAVK